MITTEDLDRVAHVDHVDPHTILGPHEEAGALVIRAFRPEALEMTIVRDDGRVFPMRRIHGLGVFEANLGPLPRAPYRIVVRYAKGEFTLRDPYAFPQSLG